MRPTAATAVLTVALVALGAPAAAGSDWEYRACVDMSGPISNDVGMRIMAEVRNRDDFQTHYESHFEIGLEWRCGKWLAVGPCYRQVTYRRTDAWRVEHRPHMNVTLKWTLPGISFSNRCRLEYRSIGSDHSSRYRNRLMLKLPGGALPRIRPYISDEPFYDFRVGELNKNRLIAGFDFKATGGLRFEINYILDRVKKGNQWNEINALGLTLKYGS